MNRIMTPDRPSRVTCYKTVVKTIVVEEIIVDDDSVAEPVRAPAPCVPSPPSAEAKTDVEADTEAETEVGVKQCWIETVGGNTPHIIRIINRYVDYIRICRNDFDHLLSVLILSVDNLLRCRREAAVGLRPDTHSLNCVHNIGLLRQECIAKIRGPADVLGQFIQGVGDSNKRLDARIPILLFGSIEELLALQVLVSIQPLACFDYFERVCAGYQHLT